MSATENGHKLPEVVLTTKSVKRSLTNTHHFTENLTAIKRTHLRKPSSIRCAALSNRRKHEEVIKYGVFHSLLDSVSAKSVGKFNRTEEDMDVEFIINEINEVREQLKSTAEQEIAGDIKLLGEAIENGNQSYKSQSRKRFVVVDTNVFIDDIEFLDDLKDKSASNSDALVLVIPWVVLHELDCIKDNKHRTMTEKIVPLQLKARGAIRCVSRWLESRHPCVTGQLPADANLPNHRCLPSLVSQMQNVHQVSCGKDWPRLLVGEL